MKNMRMLGNMILKLAQDNNMSLDVLGEKISCSREKVEQLVKGRAFASFDQLITLAELFHTSVDKLLTGDEDYYNKSVVHCMIDFSNTDNREKILDIIDDYMDVNDALTN